MKVIKGVWGAGVGGDYGSPKAGVLRLVSLKDLFSSGGGLF